MKYFLACRGLFETDENEHRETLGLPKSDDVALVNMRIDLNDVVAWIDGGEMDSQPTSVIHMRNGKSFWIMASIDVIDKMMMGK